MKKPHIPAIRAILRDYPNGRTAKQIHAMLPYIYNIKTIKSGLRKMPDAYIDRWILEPGSRGQFQAIYMVVVPPQDCPHPNDRFPEVCKSRWVDVRQEINK